MLVGTRLGNLITLITLLKHGTVLKHLHNTMHICKNCMHPCRQIARVTASRATVPLRGTGRKTGASTHTRTRLSHTQTHTPYHSIQYKVAGAHLRFIFIFHTSTHFLFFSLTTLRPRLHASMARTGMLSPGGEFADLDAAVHGRAWNVLLATSQDAV
jgi:hypothetical protein